MRKNKPVRFFIDDAAGDPEHLIAEKIGKSVEISVFRLGKFCASIVVDIATLKELVQYLESNPGA